MKTYLFNLIILYKKPILMVLGLQAGTAVLMSLQPFFFQRLVTLALGDIKSVLISEGLMLGGTLAFIYVLVTLLQSLYGYIASVFSSDLLQHLQVEFFKKLNQLPLHYFQHQSAGEFMTKFNNDIGQTQGLISHLVPSALREAITIMVVITILFYACPVTLTLLAILMVVLTSFLVVKLNQVLEKYAKKQRSTWGEINKVFDETIQGIDTLKLFASEESRTRVFKQQTASFYDLAVKAGIIASFFSPVINLIAKLGGLFLIFAAYYMITQGKIITDQFLLFFFYTGLLEASVSSLIRILSNVQPQLISAGHISQFFDQFSEESESLSPSACIDRAVSIEIKNLEFSYPHGRPLFRRAHLWIPAQSITVIHGPSGSGKSTLINLLLMFITPLAGTITLGGVNLSQFKREELRKKISVVTQFHYIFHETLKLNLSLAKPHASDKEIIEALKKAHLGEFLDRLPKGIYEVLDPRGKGISGGERQRICIARFLLKQSPILILDEPWSNLDGAAREILIQVINGYKSDATILILTHEFLPSLAVDRVYRLEPDKGVFEAEKKNTAPWFL